MKKRPMPNKKYRKTFRKPIEELLNNKYYTKFDSLQEKYKEVTGGSILLDSTVCLTGKL